MRAQKSAAIQIVVERFGCVIIRMSDWNKQRNRLNDYFGAADLKLSVRKKSGKKNNKKYFCQVGRLKLHKPEVDPSLRPVCRMDLILGFLLQIKRIKFIT